MRILLLALLLTACQSGAVADTASTPTMPAATTSPAAVSPTLTFLGRTIQVEVAGTTEARRQGLSGRASLAPDTGMVLLWPKPVIAPIWMPDMKFPIDVIFVRDNRVVSIYADRQPCVTLDDCPSFGPSTPVNYVLEVPAGSAARWGLKAGDIMELRGNQVAEGDSESD